MQDFIQSQQIIYEDSFIYNLLYLICVLPGDFQKVAIPDLNAQCLDGSIAAYYIHDVGTNPQKFIVYFEGGGWCGSNDLASTLESCYQRSKTDFGSSLKYPSSFKMSSGLLGNNQKNSFGNYTKVYLKYCDGSGHQGRKQAPISYKGVNLFFRGHDITLGTLNHVEKTHGLFSKATEIMVAGGSAGGVASMVWSNYILNRSAKKNVYNVPDAGIFLDYINYHTGQSEMKKIFINLFKISNVEGYLPVQQCVEDYPEQSYNCMFAQYLIPYIQVPIFPIMSLYDIVAMPLIVGANCFQNKSLSNCTLQQRQHIEDYRVKLINFLTSISRDQNNGFWCPACVGHQLTVQYFYSPDYTIPMKSQNTIHDTLRAWVQKKPSKHFYIDSGQWPSNQPCSGV